MVVLFLLFLFPLSAAAADFDLDTSVIGQVRQNQEAQSEVPVDGTLGLGFGLPKWEFSARTDMRLVRDFAREVNDYDLYQAVLHFRPTEALAVDFGRQFLNEGFSTEIIDGIRTTVVPAEHLEFRIYGGIPRSVERGDFNRDDGLHSGLSVALRNVTRTTAGLHFAWHRNDLNTNDLKENDALRVGADFAHQWDAIAAPRLYTLVEIDTTGRVLDAGTAGVDLFPTDRVSVNLELNYFNVNRETTRPTVFGLIGTGELWVGRLASTWTLVPGYLDFVEGYSYQRVEVQQGINENGHLIDVGLPLSLEAIGLSLMPAYYFSKSFGGDLHGVRGDIHEEFTDRWYATLGVDFTTYDKVTGNDDVAFSTVLWSGYEILKGWTISGGFEYNRNNLFERDIRGSFRLDYHYGRKT